LQKNTPSSSQRITIISKWNKATGFVYRGTVINTKDNAMLTLKCIIQSHQVLHFYESRGFIGDLEGDEEAKCSYLWTLY